MCIMGKINHFLGLNIRQSKEGIFINQESYKRNLLECFGMTNFSNIKVHRAIDTRLSPSLDLKTYRSMIGSLFYLVASRPGVIFYVCNCVGYEANVREPIPTVVKNILHYLHFTPTLGF